MSLRPLVSTVAPLATDAVTTSPVTPVMSAPPMSELEQSEENDLFDVAVPQAQSVVDNAEDQGVATARAAQLQRAIDAVDTYGIAPPAPPEPGFWDNRYRNLKIMGGVPVPPKRGSKSWTDSGSAFLHYMSPLGQPIQQILMVGDKTIDAVSHSPNLMAAATKLKDEAVDAGARTLMGEILQQPKVLEYLKEHPVAMGAAQTMLTGSQAIDQLITGTPYIGNLPEVVDWGADKLKQVLKKGLASTVEQSIADGSATAQNLLEPDVTEDTPTALVILQMFGTAARPFAVLASTAEEQWLLEQKLTEKKEIQRKLKVGEYTKSPDGVITDKAGTKIVEPIITAVPNPDGSKRWQYTSKSGKTITGMNTGERWLALYDALSIPESIEKEPSFIDAVRANAERRGQDPNEWKYWGIGLAGDVVIDPINFVGLGGTKATQAGKQVEKILLGALRSAAVDGAEAKAKGFGRMAAQVFGRDVLPSTELLQTAARQAETAPELITKLGTLEAAQRRADSLVDRLTKAVAKEAETAGEATEGTRRALGKAQGESFKASQALDQFQAETVGAGYLYSNKSSVTIRRDLLHGLADAVSSLGEHPAIKQAETQLRNLGNAWGQEGITFVGREIIPSGWLRQLSAPFKLRKAAAVREVGEKLVGKGMRADKAAGGLTSILHPNIPAVENYEDVLRIGDILHERAVTRDAKALEKIGTASKSGKSQEFKAVQEVVKHPEMVADDILKQHKGMINTNYLSEPEVAALSEHISGDLAKHMDAVIASQPVAVIGGADADLLGRNLIDRVIENLDTNVLKTPDLAGISSKKLKAVQASAARGLQDDTMRFTLKQALFPIIERVLASSPDPNVRIGIVKSPAVQQELQEATRVFLQQNVQMWALPAFVENLSTAEETALKSGLRSAFAQSTLGAKTKEEALARWMDPATADLINRRVLNATGTDLGNQVGHLLKRSTDLFEKHWTTLRSKIDAMNTKLQKVYDDIGLDTALMEHIEERSGIKPAEVDRQVDAFLDRWRSVTSKPSDRPMDNAITAWTARQQAHEHLMRRQELEQEVAKRFGRPITPGEEVPDALKIPYRIVDKGQVKIVQRVVSPEVAEGIAQMKAIWEPENISQLIRYFTAAQNQWKLYSTAANPVFHSKNAFSNMMQIVVSGANPAYIVPATTALTLLPLLERAAQALPVSKNPKLNQAVSAMRRGLISSAEALSRMPVGKGYTMGQVFQLAMDNGVIGRGWLGADVDVKGLARLSKDPGYTRTRAALQAVNPLSSKFVPIRVLGKGGQIVEDSGRLAVFMDALLAKGVNPPDAVRRVGEVLFNYSKSSKLDKTMKIGVPFWMWMSRNIPYQLEQMVKNPGRWSMQAKVYKGFEKEYEHRKEALARYRQYVRREELPAYQQASLGVRWPFQNEEKTEPGTVHIWNPGWTNTDLNMFDQGLGGLVGSITPLVKWPIEMGSDRSFGEFSRDLTGREDVTPEKAIILSYVPGADLRDEVDDETGELRITANVGANYFVDQLAPHWRQWGTYAPDYVSREMKMMPEQKLEEREIKRKGEKSGVLGIPVVGGVLPGMTQKVIRTHKTRSKFLRDLGSKIKKDMYKTGRSRPLDRSLIESSPKGAPPERAD